MPQPWVHDEADDVDCRRVREMAVLPADAAFQKIRIGRLRQHVDVVIAFQQERTAVLQMVQHMGRGVTQVSQDAEPGGAVSACEL